MDNDIDIKYWHETEATLSTSVVLNVSPSRQKSKSHHNDENDVTKYSNQVGTGSLQLQRNKISSSQTIPSILFKRMIGLPVCAELSSKFKTEMLLSLLSSRAQRQKPGGMDEALNYVVTKSGTKPAASTLTNNNDKEMSKWSKLGFVPRSGRKFEVIQEFIVIKSDQDNSRTFYLPSDSFIPKNGPMNARFTLQDISKTRLKWRDRAEQLINPHDVHTIPKILPKKVAKQPSSLLVLENDRILMCYDIFTGIKMDRLNLKCLDDNSNSRGPDNYSRLSVDPFEKDKIYISANPSSSKKNSGGKILYEVLVLESFPKLRVTHRLLFPKSGEFQGIDDLSICLGLLVISSVKGNLVELFNLRDVIKINSPQFDDCSSENDTNIITCFKKPKEFTQIKSKDGYFFHMIGNEQGDIFVVKDVKNDEAYEVRSIKNPTEIIGQFPSKSFNSEEIVSLWHYGSETGKTRLVALGLEHGLDIFEIVEETGNDKKVLKVVFSTKNFEQQFQNQASSSRNNTPSSGSELSTSSSSGKKVGLRTTKKKNYADMDPPITFLNDAKFTFEYEADLDLLAICMVSSSVGVKKETVLYTVFYDNRDFKPFLKMSPVKLPNGVGCSNITVHFYEWYLSVGLSLYNKKGGNQDDGRQSSSSSSGNWNELYYVNLVGEVVSDNLKLQE